MEESEDGKKQIQLYMSLNAIRVFGVALFAATNILFLMERGLNLYEVSLVVLAASIISFCFEIPTGAIADIYGRKLSFVYSCFIVSFGFMIYAISNSFFALAIASTIVAIGYTLESGALTAWLVDSLNYYSDLDSEQNSKLLKVVLIKDTIIRTTTGVLGIICGVFITNINITLPWILASIITAITGILALFLMKEDYFQRKKFFFSEIIVTAEQTIRTSVRYIKRSDVIKFLFLLGFVQSFTIQSSINHWQPYFSQLFQRDITLGYLRSVMLLAATSGITLSHFISEERNKKKILILLQVLIGFSIFLSGLISYLPIAIVVFLSISLATGVFGIVENVYINDNIPPDKRATILSFKSMPHSLGAGAGLIFSGFIAEQYSISITWMISGLMLIFFTLLLKKFSKEKATK